MSLDGFKDILLGEVQPVALLPDGTHDTSLPKHYFLELVFTDDRCVRVPLTKELYATIITSLVRSGATVATSVAAAPQFKMGEDEPAKLVRLPLGPITNEHLREALNKALGEPK